MSAIPPLLFTATGPIATPPATLQAALIALVSALVPGYTAVLPGSLIEDMSSTAVGALVTIDQARVDAVNNISPYSANPFVLSQLGAQFGLPQAITTNGNAFIVVSGESGYVIPPGWLVGDGTNTYVVQEGGTIGGLGVSQPIFIVATNGNTFPIPANSITQIITSVPSPFILTVTNPVAGTPATPPETIEAYRARILAASQVGLSGNATYLKTLLLAVPGVTPRLVSVLQNGSNWEVICGGGDPFEVAGAIYAGVSNPGYLVGSATTARNIHANIYDAPNTYTIVYVNPPQQLVTVAVTWNTTLTSFTAGAAVNQYIIAAVQAYINSIPVGAPINLLVMTEQIQLAVAPVLSAANLTTLTFVVTINGTPTSPTAGTSIIPGDPESYFYVSPTGVTSVQ